MYVFVCIGKEIYMYVYVYIHIYRYIYIYIHYVNIYVVQV